MVTIPASGISAATSTSDGAPSGPVRGSSSCPPRPWRSARRRKELRPSAEHRRQARRAALTRAHVLTAPLLAGWIALSSLLTGLALVLLKRPGMGAAELASVPAVLDVRTLRSRLRGRAPREVGRADLDSLFVTSAAARRRLVDDARGSTGNDDGVAARSLETEGSGSWLSHPLPWLVIAATAMSGWAARGITGELRHRAGSGLVGGELLGVRATGRQLWDGWWMAWHGQGWGNGIETSPAVAVLGGLSTLLGWLPGLGDAHSPAGIVLALLVITALPLAAVVAWRSAATFTHRRWLRAGAALAWVTSAPAAVAVGEGRIGALLALILLPRIAAGLVRAGRPQCHVSDAVRTALWSSLLATVVPLAGVVTVLVGVALLVSARANRRMGGIVLVVVPLLLAGPWLLTLQSHPARLLTGWGLTSTPVDTPPWQLALGQLPGGPVTTWWTGAILALGLLALLAPGVRRASWAVALTGLGWAVLTPHLALGRRPPGAPDAGVALTPWPGLGQLVLIGAALVAVLLAAGLLPTSLRRGSRRRIPLLPALALSVAAIGSGLVVGQHSYGDTLTTWREARPLVAVAAAEGRYASRSLVVESSGAGLSYRLIGREPGELVRDLPSQESPVRGQEVVADAVAQLLGAGEGARDPAEVLAEQGVSHLIVVEPEESQRRLVDASPGLGRLGSSAGTTTWAVRTPLTDGSTPSRVRATSEGASAPVPGGGAHADTGGEVDVPPSRRLVVAESPDWSDRVRVRADGEVLDVEDRSAVPTYELPEGTAQVSIDVGAGHLRWKVLQSLALAIALYLALPTERRPESVQQGAAR